MRHRVVGRKLGRPTSHRMAMLRNMVTSLFEHERIRTTDAKAKEIRRLADKMITLGKRGDLHARRQASSVIRSSHVTRKLFTELANRYQQVMGGYSRVIKLGPRRGDGALISLVELVPSQKGAPARGRGSGKAAARRASAKATTKTDPKKPKRASRQESPRVQARTSAKTPSKVKKRASSKSAEASTKESGKRSAKSPTGKKTGSESPRRKEEAKGEGGKKGS